MEPVFSCHFYWEQGVKFLFFLIFWPASYFLLFFFSWNSKFFFFLGFSGYTETFWSIWNKIANKIDKFYKKLKLRVKKDQFEAFLSDFFVSNEIWNLVIVVGWVVLGNIGGNTCFCLHGNALWMYAMVPFKILKCWVMEQSCCWKC